MLITFDPFIQYWQTRHHWNPWAKPSSTHPMTSFCVRTDFPPSWFMSKTFKKLHTPQILTNHLETWQICSSDNASQKLSDRFFKFETVWPQQPIKFDHEAAKQEVCQFLSSPLTYHNQTWYIDPWHHHGDAQWIWWPLTSRGRYN